MPDTVREALEALKGLGSVEELASATPPDGAPLKHNTHVHLPPNFSAFESVEQVADLAAREGLAALGASNYYYYQVYGPFAALLRRRGIFPLFGLEVITLNTALQARGLKINDPGNPGRMYLCGKGISRLDPIPAEAEALLATVRRNDGERMRLMTSRMAALFEARGLSTGLDDAAVQGRVVRRHGGSAETVGLQERHVAQAFQEVFFERVPAERRLEFLKGVYGAAPKTDGLDPVKTQNDLRAQLMKAGKAAFVEEKFLGYEEGRRLILGLGGIPCYPVLADGTSPVCPFEDPVEKLVEALRERDLHCVEFIPIRNRPEVLERYVKALRRAGLVVVAGTEHNTLDLLPLQPACVGGAPLPAGTMEVFWEGACVAAAHQFLNVHGRCGFVDAQGRPNPDYASPEERIAAFRKLGAAVIDRYRRNCRG